MKLQCRVEVMVCIMVIVSFIMVNLQPYTALFVFVLWQQPYTFPFLKVFNITCFPPFLMELCDLPC